ncbi:MAB_1171c family putative transporter [Streptomyces sp. NPDC005562]|uniref:MAB_1171c family putative transporter n=1 Tax=Streptomyces sp. NPDC005562 TaxID=3154890 RepID=UPI0033BD541E
MTTPDLFAWIVVALLTLEVARRLPAAIRNQRSRTLWFVFAALDASMITRISSVGDFLYDTTGVDDAATLTKHLVGIAAVAGLLRWVTTVVPGRMDGKREPGYRRAISNRPRRVVTWGAILVVTAIFPLSYRRTGNEEDAEFIFQQAGHFWGSLHLLLFYAYLVFGMICASMMCSAAARHPKSEGAFKYGMQALSLGCAVGSVYGILRSGYLVTRLFDKPFLGGDTFVDVGSNFALIACIVLVIVGSAAPAWERMTARMDAHGAVNDLRPMWTTMTDAVPAVLFAEPEEKQTVSRIRLRAHHFWIMVRDFWNWKDLDFRLRNRVTQICDASLQVQQYVTPQLREETERTVQDLNLPEHMARAYLLRTGIHLMKSGATPYEGTPGEPILKPGPDPLAATRLLLPIGKAMTDNVAMGRLDRRLTSV